MPKLARLAGLDLGEDIAFQERFWRIERAGWWAMALVVAVALAGGFGNGPAARATLAAGPVEVEYERIVRAMASTQLVVRVNPGRGGASVAVALDSGYLARMALQRVVPAPERVEAGSDVTRFVFASRDGTLAAVFELKPQHPGLESSNVQVDGRPLGLLRHLALP